MANNYNIEKIIDALSKRGYSNFLNPKELMMIKGKLNKNEYKVFNLYEDSNKVIIYKKSIPDLKLYEIICKVPLRHQDILGTIFSLGLNEDTYGDIIKYNGNFYIFTLPHLEDYLKINLTKIKNNSVSLKEVDFELRNNFKQEYQTKEYIVSSLRLDNVVSTITNESRNSILEKFKNKEIILNCNEDVKPTRVLKENDIFSIRRFGKYKFNKILKTTKKGGFIIEISIYK